MKSILILEDQYTKSIYEWLHRIFPDCEFPITDIIKDPMQYKELFDKVDVILLDNYFPWDSGWEEPLWCDVLEYLLQHNYTKKIVCISDYRKRLLDRYSIWNTAYERGLVFWFPSKDIDTIAEVLHDME